MGLWFSGRLWVPSPGSRTPTSQGRAEPWRASTAFPVRSGPVFSQSPRITASPRHPCSRPESPQVARGSHRGVKDPGEGKEERAAAPTPQEVSRTRAHPTSPRRAPAPRRFIPELTAGRPAEPDNEKQVQEAKTRLRATSLSLCHLDLDFAGVEDGRSEERILSGALRAFLSPGAPPQGQAGEVINLRFPQTASSRPGCCHFLL